MSYILRSRFSSTYWIAGLLLCPAVCAFAQSTACPAAPQRAGSPADTAYIEGNYPVAEEMYTKALAEKPEDAELSAALVRTLLQEQKNELAATQADRGVAANPHAPAALTALAEVELRLGRPWLAMRLLDAARTADPCFARTHLIRSRILRIDSMYASERAEIQRAYEVDPSDPEIVSAWKGVVYPAQEVETLAQALASTPDIEPEVRSKAEATMYSILPMLSETSQRAKFCRLSSPPLCRSCP